MFEVLAAARFAMELLEKFVVLLSVVLGTFWTLNRELDGFCSDPGAVIPASIAALSIIFFFSVFLY